MASKFPLKLRIYYAEVGFSPSQNAWTRFNYLVNLIPRPSAFKQGDRCIVINRKHEWYGQEVKVVFASGDMIDIQKGPMIITLSGDDLKWKRHSPV